MEDNLNHYCVCMFEDAEADTEAQVPAALGPDETEAVSLPRAAVLKSSMWKSGQVIPCRFIAGSAALQQRVAKVAKEWEAIANLTLDFRANGPTPIRIDFQPGKGSWSYIGTTCKSIPEPRATMNYGWLTDTSSETELRRVVLHEFGHAIGLIHEHQNPNGGIKWNRDAVIADLSGPPNKWSPAQIESNMFRHYDTNAVISSPVDKVSIMMYPIPKAWTLDGFSTGMNAAISAKDKLLVSQAYGL